jgi:hypothetical protein
MNSTTTFACVNDIVFSPSRSVDGLRSRERENRIGDCKISNRSNYTRVQFDHESAAAFMIPVGPYAVRVLSSPSTRMASFNLIGAFGERAGCSCTANEMRAVAYGLLAAANWIDGRDTAFRQRMRAPSVLV